MSNECIFCKIANEEIKAQFIYQDEKIAAFNDLNPQAPEHILIIPKKHIATINDLNSEDNNLCGHMITTATKIAKDKGISEAGYRLVLNCNADGGQEIYHIHLHLLAGRKLKWPPG